MAAARVFAIPELVKNILVNLDLKDLIIAARISRTVSKTIYSFKKLRETLFLEPSPVEILLRWQAQADKKRLVPFLLYDTPRTEGDVVVASHNPIFGSTLYHGGLDNIGLDVEVQSFLDLVRCCDQMCKAMFVTQPPVKEIRIKYYVAISDKRGVSTFRLNEDVLKCTGGVKIGDLIKRLEELQTSKEASLGGTITSANYSIHMAAVGVVTDRAYVVEKARQNADSMCRSALEDRAEVSAVDGLS